jgi:hypothetical protein
MSHLPPLTILEEFLLLALDDQAGEFWPLSRSAFDCATACALLMDLMRQRRIDCDVTHLFVIDDTPIGDELLDPVLRLIAAEPANQERMIIDELRTLSDEGEALRGRALQRLVDRNILGAKERKILWIFGARRYPAVHDREIRAAKLRILNTVLGDTIPDPHDIALVALADACGLFAHILSAHELIDVTPRITQVARMDPLGQAAFGAITEIEASIAMASGLR